MEKLILWGAGRIGAEAYAVLKRLYDVVAWGDNDIYKHNLIYKGIPVIDFNELLENYEDCKVVISMADYYEEADRLSRNGVCVLGYYGIIRRKVLPWRRIEWKDIETGNVRLYAGDIYQNFDKYPDEYVICCSLTNSNYRCIRHDITQPCPLPSNTIESYQIEDVLEHIEYNKAVYVLNEIYRILKRGGVLRLSMPDFHSPLNLHNSFVDRVGKVVYDPCGGGKFVKGKVCDRGHVWFPTYESVLRIIEQSDFRKYKFYRWYDVQGNIHAEDIDYKFGYIGQTKENSIEKVDFSLVVDCFKE